jgi:uncharacterized protein (DUF488 family)
MDKTTSSAGDGQVWTIGHSTRSINEFINILKSHSIEVLADVRSYPGSKRYPHFNKNSLDVSLARNHVEYIHIMELGGRRKPSENSRHSEWSNSSFRAYADYMDTDSFYKGITLLKRISSVKRTAIMCAEALWWKCHRRMIADYLTANGTNVIHIFDKDKADLHTLRRPDDSVQKELFG